MRSRNSRPDRATRRDAHALSLDPTLPAPLTSRAASSYIPTNLPRRPRPKSKRTDYVPLQQSSELLSPSSHCPAMSSGQASASDSQQQLEPSTSGYPRIGLPAFTQSVATDDSMTEVNATLAPDDDGFTTPAATDPPPSAESDAGQASSSVNLVGTSAAFDAAYDSESEDAERAGAEISGSSSRGLARTRISIDDLISPKPAVASGSNRPLTPPPPTSPSADPIRYPSVEVFAEPSAGEASSHSGAAASGSPSVLTQPHLEASSSQAHETPAAPPGPDLLCTYSCPICFCPPTNATLVPCGHVFCGACLFIAIKANLKRAMEPNGAASCPVCRTNIAGWDGVGGGVIGLRPRTAVTL